MRTLSEHQHQLFGMLVFATPLLFVIALIAAILWATVAQKVLKWTDGFAIVSAVVVFFGGVFAFFLLCAVNIF